MSSALKQAKELAMYNNKMERQNIKLQAQYNSNLAEENRDWQEMMSNSAHQREIKDLKAAGLNPVLSITGGQGATTPSGSAASVSKPNTDMSLPSKVMDMAVAQMNNATQMQVAAMQTANALTIAREQIVSNLAQHFSPSGDSISGQISNLPRTISGLFNNSFDLGWTIGDFFKNGSTNNHIGRKYSSYRTNSASTDIDELIAALESPYMDKYGNSDDAIKHIRRDNIKNRISSFWKKVIKRSSRFSNSSRR